MEGVSLTPGTCAKILYKANNVCIQMGAAGGEP